MSGHVVLANTPRLVQRAGILVVDDETFLLELLTYLLRSRGFRVWRASCGKEALKVYQERQEKIDLVLADVVMLEGDGSFLLSALQEEDPGVPVCFLSGSFGMLGAEEFLRRGAAAVFSKPCDLHELADALARIASGEG